MNRSSFSFSAASALTLLLAFLSGCARSTAESAAPAPVSHASHDHDHDHAAHAATASPAVAGQCTEHGVPEAECAVCRPDDAARLQPGESMKVRLSSSESARLIGIETAAAETGEVSAGVTCFGELTFNQNRLARIPAPAGGILHEVRVDLGDQVTENQTVARIWSAEIADTVAKAVLTHQTVERQRRLRAGDVTSEQALHEAEAAHRSACQQARTFGFNEADIEALGRSPEEPVYLELRAPFAGEIVERSAVRGARIDAGAPLFTVADRATMWAMLQVPETELPRLQVGQVVQVEVDALPGRAFTGRLTSIGAAIDEHTRRGRARAEIDNAAGQLRDRMYARAQIITRREASAVLVPSAAVQRIGGKPFVFVQRSEELFDVRAVELGAAAGGRTEVRAGLAAREPVAVRHAFAVKSAMLMSRLGEGCADD